MLSVWDLAKEKLRENKSKMTNEFGTAEGKESLHEDTYLVICGSKSCGKSSLILRFLEKDEQVRPTIALEFMYGRRSKGNSKEVGHIWELAGNLSNASLLAIPINDYNIESISIVLMVDLSTPEDLWKTIETYLTILRQRIDTVLTKEKQVKDRLTLKAWAKIGDNHSDRTFIQPLIIPLAIIGAKYDKFQFFSNKIETLVSRGRALFSHFLFNTTPSKGISNDPNKPIFISAGMDSLADIGLPPGIPGLNSKPIDLWKSAYLDVFPAKNSRSNEIPPDPSLDPQYEDKMIDSIRNQKEKDLETYVKQKLGEISFKTL